MMQMPQIHHSTNKKFQIKQTKGWNTMKNKKIKYCIGIEMGKKIIIKINYNSDSSTWIIAGL